MRALLLDERERVLLLWHSRPHDDDHWAPPGGGIEPGELPEQALKRELEEEVGLTNVVATGPIWLWRHRFSYGGALIEQHEAIYVARVDAWTPGGSANNQASDGIRAWRWWSPEEMRHCNDDIWPHGLALLLPKFLAAGADVGLPIDLGMTTPTRPYSP